MIASATINITQSRKQNVLQAALGLVAEHTGAPAFLERIMVATGTSVHSSTVRRMLLSIGKYIGESSMVRPPLCVTTI